MLFARAVFAVQALLIMFVVEPDPTEMKAMGFREGIADAKPGRLDVMPSTG